MGVVTKSHPRGFIIERLFHVKQIHPFSTPALKITSGEISAREVAGESGGKAKEHHRQEAIKAISTSKINSVTSKAFFENQRQPIVQASPSMHQSNRNSTRHHPHPEERIWAGQTPRAPDAPKIKHDKMKQFYLVDMGRKM